MAVPAQASQELLGAVADVCHRVKRMVECYEDGREPNTLDCLVFHVDRLRRILLAVDVPDEVLEAVGMAHSLIAELNSACSTLNMCGYVPTVVCENVRGRPRLGCFFM